MTTTKNGKKLPLVSPEEAIQWLLDTGLFRAKRWEDALEEWDSLTPAQRTAAVSMSLAERNSLRETAGIARRTGYHPTEQLDRLSTLVFSALTAGLEASGLDVPENRKGIQSFWDVVLSTFQAAERELGGAAPGFNDTDDIIDGKVSGDGTRFGEYEEWSSPQLRDECGERGLTRSGSRRVLIKKLLRDDARPEDGPSRASEARGVRKRMGLELEKRRHRQREDDLIEHEPDEPGEPDNG